jgi:hypothetical protein
LLVGNREFKFDKVLAGTKAKNMYFKKLA